MSLDTHGLPTLELQLCGAKYMLNYDLFAHRFRYSYENFLLEKSKLLVACKASGYVAAGTDITQMSGNNGIPN